MGIVNVTPDSFSDGGRCFDEERAVEHGLRLVAEGADVLDVGGESTRPGAAPVSEDEEARRVVPVIRALAASTKVPISVDTRRADVARAALDAGACIVNDVMPFEGEEAMAAVVRAAGAGLVTMHMRGTPATMAGLAVYDDVVAEVERTLAGALAFALSRGIAQACVVIDPGIGFAKTTKQNVALLGALGRLCRLGPVLVGASRKRFIGTLSGVEEAGKRVPGSVAAALAGAARGASVLRVHDVAETVQALAVWRACAVGRAPA